MKRKLVMAAVAVSVLAGCSGGKSPTGAPPSQPSMPAGVMASVTASTNAMTSSAIVGPTATQATAVVEITCRDEDAEEATFSDFEQAWGGKYDYCDAEATGTPSEREVKALKAAYGDEGDLEGLGVLYAMCAENNPSTYDEIPWSEGQREEYKGLSMLCPKHPQRKGMERSMAVAAAEDKERSAGLRFRDGSYLVNEEIQPGIYVTTDVDGCYWERQNRNGEAIDNYFANRARRVQVTIYKSDYGFTSDGCGEWSPVR